MESTQAPPLPDATPSGDSTARGQAEHPPSPETPATGQEQQPEGSPQTAAGGDDTVNFKPGPDFPAELQSAPAVQRPLRPRFRPKTDTVMVPNAGRMISASTSRQTGPLNDRKAAYRHWLENRSKDELIELIMSLEGREPAIEITQKLLKSPPEELASNGADSYTIPGDVVYLRLPVVRRLAVNEPTPTWRIVLVALDQTNRPIGLQIDSEITIGRAAGDASPDFDLTSFGAKNKGVSRIHALLRPNIDSLILVDMDSSNGTFWNRIRLPSQTEQPVKDGDVISFGRVNFLVKVVKSPSAHDTHTLL